MESGVAGVVDAILTAILQWRVSWLEEQKTMSKPPPICRSQSKKLKITYENYKDYESTFVPLIMHEIWSQVFEEWLKIETGSTEMTPMDVDDEISEGTSSSIDRRQTSNPLADARSQINISHLSRQFWVGVLDYRVEGQYQCLLRCQFLVDSNKLASHLKLIGDGDLVRLDLKAAVDPLANDYIICPNKKDGLLRVFGYVVDVSSERIGPYTKLADCFVSRPKRGNFHVINYQVMIAKRQLRLNMSEPMTISGLYYLKPMIRQIESVASLRDSVLASDILSPKIITCQLSIPTIFSIQSPHYNDLQYKAIIGANEALVRNIPKILLIQGPPGTGKTHTLIGIIKHFYLNWQNATKFPKILICAPSNGAIDEVTKRLHREREFLKKSLCKRSLRIVRVGHPDHINDSVKNVSLEELVEANANFKIDSIKKKHSERIKNLENELSKCDTDITNLRYLRRESEILGVELKIATLLKELEAIKNSGEISAKREVSEASKKNMRYELIKNADVILTTLNSCQRHPLDVLFKGDHPDLSFHCTIVDEASQCCEPELLMPLCYKITKMILIGDPMQLPATVISRHAQEFDYGRSLFERFFMHFGKYEPTSPVAMLTQQYRMHPDICHFPSKQFYDNRLMSARLIPEPHPLKPYVIFDLMHGSESKSDRTSIENEIEASLVRNLLVAILTTAPEHSKIGVITPYKGQKRLITRKINNLQMERHITIDVNTCDGFQGQEKDIIVLSCVRAFEGGYGSIGFLKSYQRINVALTRAKHSLMVCISAKSMSRDSTWQALINDARERRVIQTLTQTPSAHALVGMISLNSQNHTKLVRTRGGSNGKHNGFEPEYVMPMDID